LGLSHRYPEIEVYACRECNSLIGARALWTPTLRKKFIKKALARKYRKALKTKIFTDAELKEFGPTMREYILTQSFIAELTRKRIEW